MAVLTVFCLDDRAGMPSGDLTSPGAVYMLGAYPRPNPLTGVLVEVSLSHIRSMI